MVTPAFEDADDGRAIVTPSLRLAFRWAGDRWAHALEAIGPGPDPRPILLARTLEGDAGSDHPARVLSPAYQQLHWRRVDDRAEAMLVGQSGPHHFSAVFSVLEDEHRAVVAVDVADRCRAEVEALACTYTVGATSGDLVEAGPDRIAWDLGRGTDPEPGPAGLLTFSATGPARASMAEAGRRAVRVQAVARIDPGQQTHRCLYQWIWKAPRPVQ